MPSSSAYDKPLFHLSPQDPVTIKQSFEGIFVFGQTGSGKTSGPAALILTSMLQAGYGVLVLTTKRGEAQALRKMAARAGRERDVILFGPDHEGSCLNALDYLYRAPSSRGSGITDNVVSALMSLIDARERGRGQGSDPYWQDASKKELGCSIDLLGIAGETISFPNISKLILSAAYSPEEVRSEKWQQDSYLNQLINRATKRDGLTHTEAIDLGVAVEYWLLELPNMDPRPRSNVLSTVTSMIYPFTKGLATKLFSGTTTVSPENVFAGSIVILDILVKEYLQTGQ
jgi:type IV secretory pathway TraG/TraD family ATPase VirD4